MKFKFLKLLLLTLEKTRFFVFEETPPTFFSLCFGSDFALKSIGTQQFFCSVFLKTQKKLLTVKRKFLLHANFHKKQLIFRPPGIFENENFNTHAPHQNFGFGLVHLSICPYSTLMYSHFIVMYFCQNNQF